MAGDPQGQAQVRRIGPSERTPGHPTPGMAREEAIAEAGLWSGLVVTEPGMTSGWHHHGDHTTSIYVASGTVRLESGADGATVVDAGPGDFVLVPAHVVHREANPGTSASELVITRSGRGPVVVNVDGPPVAD